MKPESRLWKTLRPILDPVGFFCRVENPVDPGTPDVHFKTYWSYAPNQSILQRCGWLELKYGLRAPLNEKGLRPSQKNWATEYARADGLVLACVGIKDELFFVEQKNFHAMNDWTIFDFHAHACGFALDRFDEGQVRVAFLRALQR